MVIDITTVWCDSLVHYVWDTTSSSEPPHLQVSHHILKWAITSSSEPSHLQVSHYIFQWATTSSSEPSHLQVSHHVYSMERLQYSSEPTSTSATMRHYRYLYTTAIRHIYSIFSKKLSHFYKFVTHLRMWLHTTSYG